MKARSRVLALCLVLALPAIAPAPGVASRGCIGSHAGTTARSGKPPAACGLDVVGSLRVSRIGGLGRVEVRKGIAAVIQRDEGIVALVDISDPKRPKVIGRYDDDARDSFDGDLAFSENGRWLIYARQTHQFSLDGIHVLDVSDPTSPRLAHYQPQGGTLRVAYFRDASGEWVVTLDAIHGLIVNRLEGTTGALTPVFVDPLPLLKVGGPQSAGLRIEHDPTLHTSLLYVTTGTTGLHIYDFSQPLSPELLGSWNEGGLADIEVVSSKDERIVYAATEYWFDNTQKPAVIRLDATDPEMIRALGRHAFGFPADPRWQVQGLGMSDGQIYAAWSHLGIVTITGVDRSAASLGKPNPEADAPGAPHAYDVEVFGGLVYATDAATGELLILRP